jgi:galactokinase
VIAAAIDNSTYVGVSGRDDGKICLHSAMLDERHEFEISADVEPDEECQWANYGRGVVALLVREGLDVKGANLYIASDVPLGAGLSSSAALEVSIAKALIEHSQPDWKIEPKRLAQICQQAENEWAASPCGIMDQTVSIMGEKDHAVFLDCRDVSVRLLPLNSDEICIMTFNSMVQHEIGGGEYGKHRASCEAAAAEISKRFKEVKALRDADGQMLRKVREKLDEVTYMRASHVIGENERVLKASKSLEADDIARFGELMSQSHCSARDLYEISCEETDFLVEQIWDCEGAYGARISGGGFGGSVVALVRPAAADDVKQKVYDAYMEKFGVASDIYKAEPWQGTEIVRMD